MNKINNKKFLSLGYLFISLFLIVSCENEKPVEKNTITSDPISNEDEKENKKGISSNTSEVESKDFVYPWVDKLNIRDVPNLKGKTIHTVQSNDPLEITGEKSDELETIVLRGVVYEEPWLKIITPDGKAGWVFGGAVKSKTEKKGNAPIDDSNFDYPYFGSFDLTGWKKGKTIDESGGDAEIKTTKYSKSGKTLEISQVNVGDYGYGNVIKLYDINHQLLKQRNFNFMSDAEFRELVEIVKDYSSTPPKQYIRIQKMTKHYSQLNAYPMMADGKWQESNLDNALTANDAKKDNN